jgi:tRNA modification GTPase
MMTDKETIAAISTPPGQGGIGIVRLSGKNALDILLAVYRTASGVRIDKMATHTLRHGTIIDPRTSRHIDEVLVSYMAGPRTYTKEDVVEINCHGGAAPLAETLSVVVEQGARLAEPGEFTKRAFVNGRIDLAQAEAVIDIIRAKSEKSMLVALRQLEGGLSQEINDIREHAKGVSAQLEASVDFSDEGVSPWSRKEIILKISGIIHSTSRLLETAGPGVYIKEGIKIAIVGKPNVGKSSIMNAITKKDRSIVTPIPGTTRDVIEEPISFRGFPLLIADTAGMRETKRKVEKLGVERSKRSIKDADIVLCILDATGPLSKEDRILLKQARAKPFLVAINKCDLPSSLTEDDVISVLGDDVALIMRVSAKKSTGIDELLSAMVDSVSSGDTIVTHDNIITNLRHKDALERTLLSLSRAGESLTAGLSEEFAASDIREALSSMGEIVGETVGDDILDKIFSQFCIGK